MSFINKIFGKKDSSMMKKAVALSALPLEHNELSGQLINSILKEFCSKYGNCFVAQPYVTIASNIIAIAVVFYCNNENEGEEMKEWLVTNFARKGFSLTSIASN